MHLWAYWGFFSLVFSFSSACSIQGPINIDSTQSQVTVNLRWPSDVFTGKPGLTEATKPK